MPAAEEIARSLSGSWDLLNRRAEGLQLFQVDEQAFWRSFLAPLLAAPVFIIWLAADRVASAPGEGGSLFDDTGLVAHTSVDFAALWLTLPLLVIALADRWRLRAELAPFIIICNWSSVLAAAMLIMQMRWYAARVTLGVTAGAAALLAASDGLIGVGLLRLFV